MNEKRITAKEEFQRRNLIEWRAALEGLFPEGIPQRKVWTNRDEIVTVLDEIGSQEWLNHTFLPSGGGLDLLGCSQSNEAECIDLDMGSIHVLKPKSLAFESFGEELEWAYFRLEADTLMPTGIAELVYPNREFLTELEPGKYGDPMLWEQGFLRVDETGAEVPLPDTVRPIRRYLRGSFVIFAKASSYNRDPATYDGRHARMTADDFRAYIQRNSRST